MEQPLDLSINASKRKSGTPQDCEQRTPKRPSKRPNLPTSRVTRQCQLPHNIAARGASPTRVNGNTIFSHATLPNFQSFGDSSIAPRNTQCTQGSTIGLRHAVDLTESFQFGEKLARPRHVTNNMDSSTDPSRVPEADYSSTVEFPSLDPLDTDDYLWDEGLLPSVENICNTTECTAKSCPSCVSCEQSCYLPCDNPDECSSDICRNLSCVCSPQPTCTGHHTPIFDQCEWVGNGENCRATVNSPGQTVQHVTESHIKPQSQITCEWDSCGISTDVHRLPNHLWFDHEPASYVCLWYDCEQAFSTHEELDAHFKMVHCHMGCHWAGCEMITTSQTELQDHFSQNHLHLDMGCEHNPSASEVPPPSLLHRSSPGESSTSKSMQISPGEAVSTNASSVTSEDKCPKPKMAGKTTCLWITGQDDSSQCGMKFEDGNMLQEHVRSTHILALQSTELKCGWMGCYYVQGTKDKSKLARHAYKHTKYCFGACKYCQREFSEKSKLQQHEATHLEERSYCCEECSRRFLTQNALTNHKRVHNGEKPLVCGMTVKGEKCAYTCSDPSNMSTHKKKHISPKFACSVCERAFCRGDTLKRHMLVHDPQRMAAKKRGFCELADVTVDYFDGT